MKLKNSKYLTLNYYKLLKLQLKQQKNRLDKFENYDDLKTMLSNKTLKHLRFIKLLVILKNIISKFKLKKKEDKINI